MGGKQSRPGHPGSTAGAAGASTGSAGAANAAPTAPDQGKAVPPGSIVEGDVRYGTLSQGFNQRFSSEPAYIRLIKNEDDAVAQLDLALNEKKKLRPTVRGGGHCYEGFVDNTGGVILDLSTMRGVYESTDKYNHKTYVVEGGATNWDVYTTLFRKYGVTVPAGSCYSVGAGGHICGGGYGLLSRKHGLTVDHLVQVDVVTVQDGKKATVTRAHRNDPPGSYERDLFWAHTGGGGGNFGIILRYHFTHDLPKPPENVWISSIAWPWKDLQEKDFNKLLQNFGNFFAKHSGTDDVYQDLFSLLHLTHKSNGNITLVSQWSNEDPKLLEAFVDEIEKGMKTKSTVQSFTAGGFYLPYPEKHRKMPWFQATMTLNGSGDNQRGKYKSAYHRKPFTDAQIKALWSWLTRSQPHIDLQHTLVQIDSYGCKINARKPEDTAVPQRDSIMKLQYQTYWTDPAHDDAHLGYLRSLYADVYKDTGGVPEVNSRSGRATDKFVDITTDGAYVNYPDTDLGRRGDPDPAYPYLYYGQNYERLQEIKEHWDPENIFRHAQSITKPKPKPKH
ncbi:FAD-binding protein [Kitasatospora sp. NPDC087315]|uniref:FAD-binding protein n=1 Tax=Kitasatospora sp. NPDC087315 TaxID=3364069 RepID=UPI00381FECCE